MLDSWNLCLKVHNASSYLIWFVLLLQVLKCEYAVRGEIVTHAQVRGICLMYINSYCISRKCRDSVGVLVA